MDRLLLCAKYLGGLLVAFGLFFGTIAAAALAIAILIGVPLAFIYGAVRVVRLAWQ